MRKVVLVILLAVMMLSGVLFSGQFSQAEAKEPKWFIRLVQDTFGHRPTPLLRTSL